MPEACQSAEETRRVGTSSRLDVTRSPALELKAPPAPAAPLPRAPPLLAPPPRAPPCLALWSSSPRLRSLCRLKPTISNQETKSAAWSVQREGSSGQRKLTWRMMLNLTKLQKPVLGNCARGREAA